MWTRAQVKAKGKASFKANYWKSVLIALVLALALGGTALSSGVTSGAPGLSATGYDSIESSSSADEPADGWDEHDGGIDVKSDGDHVHVGHDGIVVDTNDGDTVEVVNPLRGMPLGAVIFAVAGAAVIGLAIVAIGFALDAFLLNPLEVGGRKFFIANLNRPAETKELGSGFDNNYIQGVKTMFLRDLFTFLWSLLFVIPGIVKFYEYRMIPYLIAENPQMDRETAFAESKRLTDGQKWNMFVLDLSFLGWDILSVMTLGILAVFYVGPYRAATNAALYEALRYGTGDQPQNGLPQGTVPPAGYGQAPYGASYGQAPYGVPYGQPNPTDPMMGYAQPMPFAQQPVQYGQPVQPDQPSEQPAQPAQPDQPVAPATYTQPQVIEGKQEKSADQAGTVDQAEAPIPMPPVSEEPAVPTADTSDVEPEAEQPADTADAPQTDSPDDLLG